MKGIDVSRWQGDIDWAKVKASGIDFAIIKAGGSDSGFYTDPCFACNYSGAKAAGLPVGAYYYVGPGFLGAANGLADAERFGAILSGRQFEFPVYMDIEESALASDKAACPTSAAARSLTMSCATSSASTFSSTCPSTLSSARPTARASTSSSPLPPASSPASAPKRPS